MSPIPGEPLKSTAGELVTSDGRQFKLTMPGVEPRPEPEATPETAHPEPPDGEPRPDRP
jgi:hypothetical protein